MRIILASKSQRRKELMDLAEFNYEVLPSQAEEVWEIGRASCRERVFGLV